MKLFCNKFQLLIKFPIQSNKRKLTNSQVIQIRNDLYDEEKAKQKSAIKRIEKIQIEYVGIPKKSTMLMNKGFSTPYNCAMHLQELLMNRSVVSLVNGQPWDMHRPLIEDCSLDFLHFKDHDPSIVNDALWRTGSVILGYIMERALKDEFFVELCSFPKPNVKSGSFTYDVDLKINKWKPTKSELECLSLIGGKLLYEDNMIERLEVGTNLALKMFENNRYKTIQIPEIAAKSPTGNSIILYRFKDHIDISKGPLIANTNQIGRFNVMAVEPIDEIYRIQGILMPKQIPVHFWTYQLLCERATKFNNSSTIAYSNGHKEKLENAINN